VSGTGYEPQGAFQDDGRDIQLTDVLEKLLQGAALASDARLVRLEGRWSIQGDPTEGALVVAAAKAGFGQDQLEDLFLRVDEVPFSSERKRMTTLHRTADGHVAYAKGAPEVILTSCNRQLTEDGERPLDAAATQSIRDAARQMAQSALRVLAVALKANTTIEDAENDMVFVGLIGISDPPRPEAKAAIQTCAQAGIRPVMITGDHPQTAQAVAIELGLGETQRAVTGVEIDTMSDVDLESQVCDIQIYARVSPQHKLRVVEAWQKLGHIVAMTGDGVNDAPALKKADIGVAMGITGTDVSKEAADMTLADDNFASIVGAVEEGRIIFGNIKKYLMYLLSSNIGEIGLIAIATLAGYPLPLTAVQILYVNLATDGLPALALAVDPPEADLMRRPPRDPRSGVFTRPVITLMLIGGVWSMMANFVLFTWALGSGRSLEHAMAMTFVSLTLIQFFKAYNFRSERESVLVQPFTNKWLNLAIIWELVLLSLIVYWPALQQPFGTYSFSMADWMIVVGFAFTVVPVLETNKWIVRHARFSPAA
jgi:Ca2+-transporting ATPase